MDENLRFFAAWDESNQNNNKYTNTNVYLLAVTLILFSLYSFVPVSASLPSIILHCLVTFVWMWNTDN